MKRQYAFILVAVLMVFSSVAAQAQSYKIDWYCISSGGGEVAGGSYKINCTVGQPSAGYVEGASLKHWIGFWVPDVGEAVVCDRIDQAKLLPDGTLVTIGGKIATSGPGDFSDFFYIEEATRFSGIRVAIPSSAVSELARGKILSVTGYLGTTADGERQLTSPIAIVTGTAAPLDPLGMTNKALGGKTLGAPPLGQQGVTGGIGVNNVGLLVKTWGKVVAVDAGMQRARIDDGSSTPVWVDCSLLSTMPAVDDYLSVVGVSSLLSDGGCLRYVLPRTGDVPGY